MKIEMKDNCKIITADETKVITDYTEGDDCINFGSTVICPKDLDETKFYEMDKFKAESIKVNLNKSSNNE